MTLEDLQIRLLKTNSKLDQVEAISEYILYTENSTNPENAKSSEDIFSAYKNIRKENDLLPEILANTFIVYLSKVANLPQSKINCDGRKQGYYIDSLVEKIEEIKEKEEKEREEKEVEEERKNTENTSGNSSQEVISLREKDMYPFLKNWLLTNGYDRVADISNERSQKGKWANPDLVGFKIDNLFGATEVEITTIEAKITNDDWKQWFFEAVAHTVFSNRSYYAFIHPKNLINKIAEELRHYAEIFNLGILIIAVDGDDFLKLKNKQTFSLSENNHSIIEYCPAKFNDTHIKYKKKFLSGLGINEPINLYNYGEAVQK